MMKGLIGLVIIFAIGFGQLGVGVKVRNDLLLSTASIRYYTTQGIGFDGQFGFSFDGSDQYLFGGSGIFPVMVTKHTSFNITTGLVFSHMELMQYDLLEINFTPEVEFSFPTIDNLKFEFDIPVFSIGFDLDDAGGNETVVSVFARRAQLTPFIGFHYYF